MLPLLLQGADDVLSGIPELLPVAGFLGFFAFVLRLIVAVYREMVAAWKEISGNDRIDKDKAVAALSGLVISTDALADEFRENRKITEGRLDSIDRAVQDVGDLLRRGG